MHQISQKCIESESKVDRGRFESILLFISVFDAPSMIEGASKVVESASNVVERTFYRCLLECDHGHQKLSNVTENASE